MKLSALLASRSTIIRQAALAHTASAWLTLSRAADRVDAARLRGAVRIRVTDDPEDDAPWASFTSDDIRTSVLEEHFSDEDLQELAEAIAFAADSREIDETFRIEILRETYAEPLLRELKKSGVTLDLDRLPASPPPI